MVRQAHHEREAWYVAKSGKRGEKGEEKGDRFIFCPTGAQK